MKANAQVLKALLEILTKRETNTYPTFRNISNNRRANTYRTYRTNRILA